MAKMAVTSATKFMVLAVLVAIMLLMCTEVATAALDNAEPEVKLGRRLLQAEYSTTGRGGYNGPITPGGSNSYNNTGRGGYN